MNGKICKKIHAFCGKHGGKFKEVARGYHAMPKKEKLQFLKVCEALRYQKVMGEFQKRAGVTNG